MTTEFWGNRQQRTQKKNMVATFRQIMSVHDGYLGRAPIHVRIIVDDDNVQWSTVNPWPREAYGPLLSSIFRE